uniref:TROVE domain-containing protein n=1 Tax=candidate division CPR3 bacterium TaxID=2268181 RepID=A0A7C4R5F6_UNCC3
MQNDKFENNLNQTAVAEGISKETLENLDLGVIETPFVNKEGAPTFRRELAEQVIQVLTTNTLENTFYVGKDELKEDTVRVLEKMKNKDPEFLAKALVFARNEGYLQKVPTMGLAVLSTSDARGGKEFFKKAFNKIIQTPDNLSEFVRVVKKENIRKGLGGVALNSVKEWLKNISGYQAVKYSATSTNNREKFTLRDILKLARPKPENKEMEERFGWIVNGWKEVGEQESPTNPQIWALEKIKRSENNEEIIDLIERAKLPWEAVIPAVKKMNPEIWESLMRQMPYMALLRNINNFSKNGLLEKDENVEYIVSKLTSQRELEKAKVLPFRLYTAWKAYQSKNKDNSVDSRIVNALETALENSFVNIPEIKGSLAIGSDVSGSMSMQVSDKGDTSCREICGVFTGALLKKSKDKTHVLPFETVVKKENFLASDSILTNTEKIARMGGGGTAVGAPIEHLLKKKIKVDNFIGITDNEDWAYGRDYFSRYSFLEAWREYKKTINPKAKAFLITLAPYRDAVAPQNEKDVHFIYGWNESVLKYISQNSEDKNSQVEKIKNIKL